MFREMGQGGWRAESLPSFKEEGEKSSLSAFWSPGRLVSVEEEEIRTLCASQEQHRNLLGCPSVHCSPR